jgi:hypothetical protein
VSPYGFETRVSSDGKRARAHDLHPRVLLRIVRRGDAHAAVEAELADGVVDHLGADEPEVEDVGAAVGRPFDQRGRHRRRREPHVAADGDPARPEMLDVAPSDPVGAVLVELRRVDPADVVGLENGRREHAPDARGSDPAAATGSALSSSSRGREGLRSCPHGREDGSGHLPALLEARRVRSTAAHQGRPRT